MGRTGVRDGSLSHNDILCTACAGDTLWKPNRFWKEHEEQKMLIVSFGISSSVCKHPRMWKDLHYLQSASIGANWYAFALSHWNCCRSCDTNSLVICTRMVSSIQLKSVPVAQYVQAGSYNLPG